MSTVIKVENLSKQYRLGQVGTGTISHDVNRWWHKIRGKEDPYLKIGESNDRTVKGQSDYVWALKDINFEVQQGEVLGIIGRNGAGKSTLLKILSRTTAPTTGSVKIKGRVASLLEVGTGFHPELSGRDNIFLNGAILGMSRQEIKSKFDEIVDFAGVERYIDTPVKRYSSGMYVRLAFAVAAHLEPEILIVDEVLAVGDAEFQKKCLGKMKDVSVNQGRTVLFVSHNLPSILELCDISILIASGKIKFHGNTSSILNEYAKLRTVATEVNKLIFLGELSDKLNFIKVLFNNINPIENEILITPNDHIEVQVVTENLSLLKPFRVTIAFFKDSVRVLSISDQLDFGESFGKFISKFSLDSNILRPGLYHVGIGARTQEDQWVWNEQVFMFEIINYWEDKNRSLEYGIIDSNKISLGQRILYGT